MLNLTKIISIIKTPRSFREVMIRGQVELSGLEMQTKKFKNGRMHHSDSLKDNRDTYDQFVQDNPLEKKTWTQK